MTSWLVRVPLPEALWLAGPLCGPLVFPDGRARPGEIRHLGGGLVRLNQAAVDSLRNRQGDDGQVTDEGAVQVLWIGKDAYVLWEETPEAEGA